MNRCDDCGTETTASDGAFCWRCETDRYWARHHEYWDDDDMPDQPEILAEWADEGRPL